MTDDDRSKVAFHRHDAEMEGAFVSARETFRFFWREVAWEKRRIVKAWDLVSVKAAFGDDNGEIEHMWLSDVEFDGQYVSGALQNTPLHVNARKGDQARVLPSLISDWLLGNAEEVCGGYTVHLLRTRMTAQERGEHDRAWGLGFGDPSRVNVFPRHRGGGLLRRMFAKGISETDEHPMSVNMAGTLRDELAKHPSMATEKDDRGGRCSMTRRSQEVRRR